MWPVFSNNQLPFNPTASFVYLAISTNLPLSGNTLGYPVDSTSQPNIFVGRSRTSFKEFGVIGSESIRTETETPGNYKVGINTVARAPHSAYRNAFVSVETTPRANLDVVGNVFISGKTIDLFASEPGTTRTETLRNNALLVGGDSASPDSLATFRIATTNNGRVGINTTLAQLDRTFVVTGDGKITNDFEIGGNVTIGTISAPRDLVLSNDLAVNGGDITSTSTTFNLLNNSTNPTLSLNFAGFVTTLNIGHLATGTQTVNLGTSVTASQTLNIGTSAQNNHIVNIGTVATGQTTFNLHNTSQNSIVTIGTVPDNGVQSLITIGGAKNNPLVSKFTVRNAETILEGNLTMRGNTFDALPSSGQFNFIPSSLSIVKIAENTSDVEIAAVSGTTTVRNALKVNSTATVESSITLNGGLANSAVDVVRNILGRSIISTVSRDASNVATIVTTVEHNLTSSSSISISCGDNSFDVINVTPTIISPTSFSYSNPGPSVPTKSETGSIIVSSLGLPHGSGDLSNRNVDYYRTIKNISGDVNINTVINNQLIVNSHFFTEGNPVEFVDTGNLVGVITGVTYYILSTSTDRITLSASSAPLSPVLIITLSFGSTDAGTARIKLTSTRVQSPGSGNFFTRVGNITQASRTNNIVTATLSSALPAEVSSSYFIEIRNASNSAFNTPPTRVTVVNSTTIQYQSIGSDIPAISITATALNSTLFLNNPSGIFNNDYLLIDEELVRTASAPSSVSPFIVPVFRAQDDTALISHGSGSQIVKFIKTQNATFVSSAADSTQSFIELEEFGGTVSIEDYFRIDGGTVSAEWVRITGIRSENAQRFIINTGTENDNVFQVLSTNGNTDIRGDVTIGTSQSQASGLLTGGGNLRVHNSIELFGNTATTYPERQYFVITNGSAPKFYVQSSNGNTRLYDGGNLEIFADSFFGGAGGTFDKTRQDNASQLRFQVSGSSGNVSTAGTLRVVGNTTLGGTFTIRDNVTVGSDGSGNIRFIVDSDGDTFVSRYLTVDGVSSLVPSSGIRVLSVDKLGVNGVDRFAVNQDRSISAFGYNTYLNANGGLRAVYLSNTGSSDTNAVPLQSNTNYFVRPSSTLVLRLPTNAITGDVIRIVDVAGNLNFNVHLVVRAPAGVNIQGSSGGSKLGGRTSAYGSGELIVNTPNAAFGLIYLGSSDSEGNSPATDEQGWYLMDI